jgi:Glycosyl hydrolase family 47
MIHSWKGYEAAAFGRDELLPVSLKGDDSLGGLGISLVEALPSLNLMGLESDFQRHASLPPATPILDFFFLFLTFDYSMGKVFCLHQNA